jgi:hypothetical protein
MTMFFNRFYPNWVMTEDAVFFFARISSTSNLFWRLDQELQQHFLEPAPFFLRVVVDEDSVMRDTPSDMIYAIQMVLQQMVAWILVEQISAQSRCWQAERILREYDRILSRGC